MHTRFSFREIFMVENHTLPLRYKCVFWMFVDLDVTTSQVRWQMVHFTCACSSAANNLSTRGIVPFAAKCTVKIVAERLGSLIRSEVVGTARESRRQATWTATPPHVGCCCCPAHWRRAQSRRWSWELLYASQQYSPQNKWAQCARVYGGGVDAPPRINLNERRKK